MSYNLYPSTSVVATVLLIIATTILIRLAFVIRCIQNDRRRDINIILQTTSLTTTSTSDSNKDKNNKKKQQQHVKTMIILGSGGHTTEMIRLLQELDPCTYTPVVYVLAESDTTSIERLQKYIKEEEENNSNGEKRSSRWVGRYPIEKSSNQSSSIRVDPSKQASVYRLPRAREVHQSYYTSIFTTIHSFLQTLILLNKIQPELLLTNGPGTCIPVIYSLFLHRILSFRSRNRRCKIIFVESLCRVQTLSLSGKLVYPIVDRFIVHWPYLKEKYPLVDVCDVFVRHDSDSVDSSKDE